MCRDRILSVRPVVTGRPGAAYCMESLRSLYSLGVIPGVFLNCRRKVLTLLIPTSADIADAQLGSARSSTAFEPEALDAVAQGSLRSCFL